MHVCVARTNDLPLRCRVHLQCTFGFRQGRLVRWYEHPFWYSIVLSRFTWKKALWQLNSTFQSQLYPTPKRYWQVPIGNWFPMHFPTVHTIHPGAQCCIPSRYFLYKIVLFSIDSSCVQHPCTLKMPKGLHFVRFSRKILCKKTIHSEKHAKSTAQ